ncbi:MAG: pilus assembly protein PilM [Candidatus Margulisbacteria bacterium]|nr:pilus assembly protein PilM [Candidatus Margulisiibacteriota bacterium]
MNIQKAKIQCLKLLKNKKSLASAGSVIGLDISEGMIRAIQLKRTQNQCELNVLCQEKIPPEMLSDDLFKDPKKGANFIKKIWAKNNIKTKKVSVVLFGKDVLVRMFTFPKSDKEFIEPSLQNKVNQFVQFSGIDISLSWKIVESGDQSENIKVFMAAVKKDIVQSYISMLEKAGLVIVALVPYSIAFIQAINGSLQLKTCEDSVLVVIIENDTLYMAALIKRKLTMFFEASVLGSGSEMSLEELEINFNNGIKRILYGRDITLTPKKLLYVDKTGTLTQTVERWGEQYNLTVEACQFDFQDSVDTKSQSGLLPYAAFGLAIGEEEEINLIPESKEIENLLYFKLKSLSYGLLLLSFVMIGILWGFNMYHSSYHNQAVTLKKQIVNQNMLDENSKRIQEEIRILTMLINGRKDIIKDTKVFNWYQLAHDIQKHIPSTSRLSSIQANQMGHILLSGESSDQASNFEFIKNLKKIPYFNSVMLQEVSITEEDNINRFTILAKRK